MNASKRGPGRIKRAGKRLHYRETCVLMGLTAATYGMWEPDCSGVTIHTHGPYGTSDGNGGRDDGFTSFGTLLNARILSGGAEAFLSFLFR